MERTGAAMAARPPQFDARPAGNFPWSDVLQYMIAPFSSAEFYAEYYERKPLIVHRSEPGRYSPLLSVEKIDRFIGSADLRGGMVDLADQGRELHREDYVNEGNLIIRRDIVREYQRGATVILPQLHHSDPVLASFCQAIETVFSSHTQTNIYLTPQGRQGFPTHYDNHDVFVMQVSGRKRWRLYNVAMDTPYRGEGFERNVHKVGEKVSEFILEPGDCVYIPRGMMHDANNEGEEASLHITVGLIVKTWADLMLEAVSQLMVEETAFRRSLPVGHARNDFDRTEAQATFKQLTQMIADRARMDDAFDLLADQFIRSRDQDVSDGIMEATAPVTAEMVFCRREFVPWRIADDDDLVVLISAGGDTDFPASDVKALERAMSGKPFTLKDLNVKDPVEMVRKLTAAGAVGSV